VQLAGTSVGGKSANLFLNPATAEGGVRKKDIQADRGESQLIDSLDTTETFGRFA
jgi:hypothetical protein